MARSPAAQIFDSLMMSGSLPDSVLDEHGARALATIVGHAARTVPFYRDRLRGVLNTDGSIDMDAWQRMPPLTRQDLQESKETLTSTQIPAAHGEASERSTSGTSGKPVTVLVTERTKMLERALMGRLYTWTAIDPAHRLVILQGGRHPLLDYRQIVPEPWVPDWMAGPNPGGYARLHYPVSAEDQLAYLATVGSVYFNTQPSNFRRALHAIQDGRAPRPDVRGLLSLGEMVTAEDRQLAKSVLGCPILDVYSATDVGTIASQCSHGSLHVNGEAIRVEAIRSDGSPCQPGEEGRLLLTTLANAAMPLLRYDIGDIGALGGECGCGLTLPKLTLTVGRERRVFRFSDGSVAVPAFRMEKFAESFPVRQWQLAQTSPETVELRFVSDADDAALAFNEVADAIRTAFGRPLDVGFHRAAELVGQSGKLDPAIRLF